MKQKETGRRRPRLFLCPTGAFSGVPLHAAGSFACKTNVECCSDYFVASYTPTLSTLRRARMGYQKPTLKDTKILLAAVPIPFKLTPLQYTAVELQSIQDVIPRSTLVALSPRTSFGPSNADAKFVLNAVQHVDIAHLASHCIQDPNDPLSSGFVMADRMLTVSELMALDLPKAFLAFLSACETAKGDARQPDQVVHLAATMLFAGFRSVIGTLW